MTYVHFIKILVCLMILANCSIDTIAAEKRSPGRQPTYFAVTAVQDGGNIKITHLTPVTVSQLKDGRFYLKLTSNKELKSVLCSFEDGVNVISELGADDTVSFEALGLSYDGEVLPENIIVPISVTQSPSATQVNAPTTVRSQAPAQVNEQQQTSNAKAKRLEAERLEAEARIFEIRKQTAQIELDANLRHQRFVETNKRINEMANRAISEYHSQNAAIKRGDTPELRELDRRHAAELARIRNRSKGPNVEYPDPGSRVPSQTRQ